MNFCLGLLLDVKNEYYVPASTLLEDIKQLTSMPSQVLAIFSKEKGEMVYKNVRHVAKGLNLNKIELPKEIDEKILLKDYLL